MTLNDNKLLAVGGVGLLVAAVAVVLLTPPARGYELSMYDAFPLYFWVCIVGALFLGGLVVLRSARVAGDGSWTYGLLIVVVSNALLVLLPQVHGYPMYGRADAMSHVGITRSLLETGSTAGNIYPPTHLLLATGAEAMGGSLMTVSMVVTAVSWFVYFGAAFYVLAYLFQTREQILFGLPFALLPAFDQVGLRPFDVSVLLLPLVVYLLIKGQQESSPATRAVFVVVLVAFLLYHPLTALFMLGGLSFYYLSKRIPHIHERFTSPTALFSLAVVLSVAWYSNFVGIIRRFDRVYNTFFGVAGDEGAPVDQYTGTLEQAAPPLLDVLRVALFRNGLEFALFGLGLLFVLVTVWLVLRTDYRPDTYTVMLVGIATLFSVGGMAFLLFDLIVPYSRPFKLAKIGAVLIAGNLFYLV